MNLSPSTWPRSRAGAALLLAGCALLWSSAGVLSRLLEAGEPFDTAFWRSVFCALTMLLILSLEHRHRTLQAITRMGWVGLMSGLMWAIMFTGFMVAMMVTSVANTLLVIGMAPILAALLAWRVLGDRVTGSTWTVIAIAALGLWWMVRDALSIEGPTGLLIAAAVPVASAVNLVMIRRTGARVDLAPAVLLGALISGIVLLPFIWPVRTSIPASDLLVLALLGAFQLALPCWLMVRAARLLRPHEVSLIALLEVVLGPLWVWLGVGETTSTATLQGGALILLALVTHELLSARAPHVPARTTPPG